MSNSSIRQNTIVAQRLRTLRESRNISQTRLAKLAGIPFDQVRVGEAGVEEISIPRLIEFARVFDVPVSHFLAGLDDLKKPVAEPTVEELQLLTLYRASPSHAQHSILRIAQETAQLCA